MTSSSAQQLSEKLKLKQQQDHQAIQNLIQQELTQLTESFRKQLNAVLNTTLSATEANLKALKRQSQQLQVEYEDHQAASDQRFKRFLILSGLFQLLAALILVGGFYGSTLLNQEGLTAWKSLTPQMTQAEQQQLKMLQDHSIQVILNRQGQPYLLLPKSESPPHVRQHPNRPNQWLIPLNASGTRMPTQASSQATISSTSR